MAVSSPQAASFPVLNKNTFQETFQEHLPAESFHGFGFDSTNWPNCKQYSRPMETQKASEVQHHSGLQLRPLVGLISSELGSQS